jgi:F0F1-type ATP synthase delta subunit
VPTHKIAQEIAAVLTETNKSKDVTLLAQDIAWELENRGQLASVEVTSASRLTESLRREITEFIKQSIEVDQVALSESVDESVIGGVRIETAAHTWDHTIAKQLTDIREAV